MPSTRPAAKTRIARTNKKLGICVPIMLRLHEQGLEFAAIAKELNRQSYTMMNGKPWYGAAVRNLVLSRTY